MKIESYSTEDTFAFGERCGREAKAGQVFCLYGDLGVGKTVFTQGFAKGALRTWSGWGRPPGSSR